MDLNYHSEKFENSSLAEGSTTMPPASATSSSSNGYTILVAPDDDDGEQYEVLDNVHSDFLQHFENEIRISPLCVEEHTEILNDLKASLAGDASRSSKKWKKLQPAADGVVSENSNARRDNSETSQTLLHSHNGMPPVTDQQYVARVSDFLHVQSHGSALGSILATGSNNQGSNAQSHLQPSTASVVANTLLGDLNTAKKPVTLSPSAITFAASAAAAAAAAPRTPAGVGSKSSAAVRRGGKDAREPSLSVTFPAKVGPYELKIIRQPEDQHRARYLTEGSRGTVKDKSQQSHPTVQLTGYDQVVVLQVFIGTETGRMKPHGFYQACKVSSKNSTPCIERDIEGTTVIEILLEPKNDMVAVIDCIGILKLRNADVEQRIGLAKSKKKSTSARLIFRVNIPKVDGTLQTLQIASTPVICTQPIGAPEISKKSISQSSPAGGEEMFIIGKNFMKGTVVVFEEVRNDRVVWSAEAEIDQDYFQATHLVCRVPPYNCTDVSAMQQKEVQIVVHSNGRTSEPVSFFYVPVSRLSEQKCVQHNSSVSSPSSLDKLNSPVCSDKTIISALEQTVETKGDLTLRLSDGSSLKRPYDPSSQEDLSRIAKSVAINHAAAADDKAAIRHQAVNLAQPDLTEQTVGGVDQTVDGSSLSAVRSQSVGRGGELDSDVVRHLGSHGDLFQQHIDASAMRLEADMSVVSIKSDIAAADVSRPVILSSFQSPAQASTNDMTLFESTSVAQPVEIASNLPIQPTGSVLDFVQTNHSSIVLDSVEGRHHLGEPHPKRQASFPTAELPVQMLMLMNNGADKVDDMKMQWGSVGGNISASNVAAGTDPTQQTHGQATNDVFRFASLSTLDGSAANGGVLFNFGNNHGIVFASQFPSDAAAALGGFGDGAALDMATCGNDSIVLSSGPQRMDTNVSHYAVDSSGDAFVRGGANSGVGGGYVDGIDGGQRFSPSQSSNDLQNVHNTIASMLTACQSAGLVQHSMEAMPHTTGGGMLAGSGPSDGGLAAPSIVRMDVSNSPIPAAGLATISGDISDNMVPCAADMVVKPHSEGGDTSPYGDSSTHCFTAADAAHHNYVATSVVGMDISSAVQIAGMNMPEISPQPLSIVTMPLGDSGNLQQSLAELLNLQQQVAGTTPSGSSKTNSAPQSPPYRRSSMSRHDMSGHTDLAAAVATEDIAVQNSGVGFIDSRLSPAGGHPAPFPAGHGFIQSTNDLSSSATGMMQSSPGNTTCYDSSYRHEHTTAAEMYSVQVSTPAAASLMCSDEVGANVQNAATLSQWVSQQQQQDDGSFLLGNADLFGGGGQVNLKREEQYADNVLGLLVDKSGAWNQLSQVHGIDAAGPDGTVGQHHVTSADLSAVASSEIAGLSDIQSSTIVSPVGGMLYSTEQPYVILVSSTPQGHPGSHHGLRTSTETSTLSNGDHSVGVVQLSQPVLNTLTESSAMGGGSPSVPFLLVASLQSNDVNSAALDTVPAISNMASNPASCHGDVMRLDHAIQGVLPYGDALKSSDTTRNARIVEHGAIAAESKSAAAPSASVSGEQRSPEVPLLLYKLLTEDTVPTATQPTPLLTASLDSSSLPDLSFDDINQVLNSSSLSHSG